MDMCKLSVWDPQGHKESGRRYRMGYKSEFHIAQEAIIKTVLDIAEELEIAIDRGDITNQETDCLYCDKRGNCYLAECWS